MRHDQYAKFKDIDIYNGFWHDRQQLNGSVTIYAIWKRFQENGRFSAFRFDWKDGMPDKPHYFYDSDVAKWMEAAAYILQKNEDPQLEAIVDETVDLIEAHQHSDGYFNIWFTVVDPGRRFQDRGAHELYCAGHLFEAAVAYHEARGKDKFLHLMCRYADYIERIFKLEQSAAFMTPGHEEIELALIKLYRCTGETRYLELSKWFLDRRGNNTKDFFHPWAKAAYAQDHLPVRRQTTAEGHAVRAAYLYCGMADAAFESGDEELLKACRVIFDNIVHRRMYVTGGIGSSRLGEAFTVDYDLPDETAYSESCAAIALAMFARRMQQTEADSRYADVAELVLYNGFLSGTSLDGKGFFYENPLEIDLMHHGKDKSVCNGEVLPITQRAQMFECACCPPNIARFTASIGDYLYTYDEAHLFIHQYMESTGSWDIGGSGGERRVKIRQETRYPVDGCIVLTVCGCRGMRIGLRIPGWCHVFTLLYGGRTADFTLEKGYVLVDCDDEKAVLELRFDMEPELLEAFPLVHAAAGRAALRRGPVVYCLEGVDNGSCLQDVMVDAALQPVLEYSELCPFPMIKMPGWQRGDPGSGWLYRPLSSGLVPRTLTFIPYYAFANRGESDMQVWVRVRR